MRTFLLGATLSLALAATGAMAQSTTTAGAAPSAEPAVAASAVGHWLYGPQGDIIGSVRSLTDGGRIAVVMIGSYFRPGSHEERIPAGNLSIIDGKVTLQDNSALALNRASAR